MESHPLHERLLEEARKRNKMRSATVTPPATRPATRLQSRLSSFAACAADPDADADSPASPAHEADRGGLFNADDVSDDIASDVPMPYTNDYEVVEEEDGGVFHVYEVPANEADSYAKDSGYCEGGNDGEEHAANYDGEQSLREIWKAQEAHEKEERAAALERAGEEYEVYMMARLEQKTRTEDELTAWEAQEREFARRAARVEERAKRTRADAAVKAKRERERFEARKLELARERAEREEQTAEKDVKDREARVLAMEIAHSNDRILQLENENEEEMAIELMREDLRRRERNLVEMRQKRKAQERELADQKDKLMFAKSLAVAKKEARIKATKEADDHPTSLALRYSRSCTICLTANPRRRAVMIACGHMTCALCAENLVEPNSKDFPCPFCRKQTTYIKMFEDLEDAQEVAPSSSTASTSAASSSAAVYAVPAPSTSARKRPATSSLTCPLPRKAFVIQRVVHRSNPHHST